MSTLRCCAGRRLRHLGFQSAELEKLSPQLAASACSQERLGNKSDWCVFLHHLHTIPRQTRILQRVSSLGWLCGLKMTMPSALRHCHWAWERNLGPFLYCTKKKTSVYSIQQCAEDCHQVLAFKKLLKSTNVKWNGCILSCWDLVPEIVARPFQCLPCPALSGECHALNPAINAGQRVDTCEPWRDHANTHKNEWIIF